MSAALALALWAPVVTTVAAVITVHNNSNCCCQNIYPRSAANLVSTVDECIASCQRDALCHAAIMISTDVKGQCQLAGPAPAGKSCCIHKPHFDSLNPVAATAGETTIDMGTSRGSTGCQCNASGWGVPCVAPVPAGCMMYRGSGSGVFGPCSSVGPPLPPAPNYDEAHRPIFHLTPEKGHNNDPNGMFYDPVHRMYHIFVQYKEQVIGGAGPEYWYHFASPNLAVGWRRVGVSSTRNVTGCSGGATIAPDATQTPTLVICGGTVATPSNRSDPFLTDWDDGTALTKFPAVPGANESSPDFPYFPPGIPGRWDCSVTKQPSGKYVTTFGSCLMANGTVRPHQGTGYCDGAKQDGTPQILAYESVDFETWKYLGEPFQHREWTWPIPSVSEDNGKLILSTPHMVHVPRVECPYSFVDAENNETTILKLSMAGTGKDFIFLGSTTGGNGSIFTPSPASGSSGVLLDWGGLYASAVLADTQPALPRSILFGWIFASYNLGAAVGGATFDCALSLPRVMSTKMLPNGILVPTWEIAPEVASLRINPTAPTLLLGLLVPPNSAVPISLPKGATGDALELRLNVSGGSDAVAGTGLSVRATAKSTILAADQRAQVQEQTLIYFLQSDNGSLGLMVASSSADHNAHNANVVAQYPRSEVDQPSATGGLGDREHVYSLRVFVDKSVIEAHVDARLSVTTRAYPLLAAEATHAFVINRSPTPVTVESVEVWGMRSLWDEGPPVGE